MSTQLQLRRGTTAQHSTFTGAAGEITVDTDKKTVVVHDGSTAGGNPLATAVTPTFSGNVTLSSGTANGVAYLNGSKVLTTGSALTFDGSNLNINCSAAVPFRVQQSGSNDTGIEFQRISSTNAALFSYNRAGSAYTDFSLYGSNFVWLNSGTEQMRLTSTGLGIGTSSPSAKLHVYSAAGGGNILLNGAGTNTQYQTFNTSGGNYYIGISSSTGTGLLSGASAYSMCLVTESARDMIFGTNNTEKMRLDSSGNLGLGVTPSASTSTVNLQVKGTAVLIGNSSGAEGAFLTSNAIFNSGWKYISTAAASRYEQGLGTHAWFTAPSGTAGNAISFTQAMTLTSGGALQVGNAAANIIQMFHNQSVGYIETAGTSATPIGFATSGTERMRIDSSGNLLVGTTSQISGAKVSVVGRIAITEAGGDCFVVNATGGTNTGYVFVTSGTAASAAYFATSSGSVFAGNIAVSGSSTSYSTSSDYRLKENIAPMQGALATVSQLKPVTYNWKVDGSSGQGFIAHELQAVVPDCVTGEKDAVDEEGKPVYQGIDTSFLVATLTKAIQEQQEQINQLKAEVAALKSAS